MLIFKNRNKENGFDVKLYIREAVYNILNDSGHAKMIIIIDGCEVKDVKFSPTYNFGEGKTNIAARKTIKDLHVNESLKKVHKLIEDIVNKTGHGTIILSINQNNIIVKPAYLEEDDMKHIYANIVSIIA